MVLEDFVTASAAGQATLTVPTFNRDVAIKVKPALPRLAATPEQITAQVYRGLNTPDGQFTLANTGYGSATYTITDDASWLSTSPTTGIVTNEEVTIDVIYATSTLDPGTYSAQITIDSPETVDGPLLIPVELTVVPFPIDTDTDGDVDLSDYGAFQSCLTERGQAVTDPDCAPLDLTGDRFINQDDIWIVQRCLSGSGVPVDPECLNP
jgi:hypothetical protein